MKRSFFNMLPVFIVMAFTLASSAVATAAPVARPAPFSAEYVLSKGGKVIGMSVFTLAARGDDVWRYASVTRGTAGLAGLLGAKVTDNSMFRWHDGRVELLGSQYRLDATLHSQSRDTRVDWKAGTVSVTDSRKGAHSYPAQPGLLDRHLLSLALGRHLEQNGRFGLPVATHDRAETQHFEVAGNERVEVPAGSFSAVRVQRVDSGKHLSAWYVPARFPIPVKLVHGGDDQLTLELKSFSG